LAADAHAREPPPGYQSPHRALAHSQEPRHFSHGHERFQVPIRCLALLGRTRSRSGQISGAITSHRCSSHVQNLQKGPGGANPLSPALATDGDLRPLLLGASRRASAVRWSACTLQPSPQPPLRRRAQSVVEHPRPKCAEQSDQDHMPWGPDPGLGQLRRHRIRKTQRHDEPNKRQDRTGSKCYERTKQMPQQPAGAKDGQQSEPKERSPKT